LPASGRCLETGDIELPVGHTCVILAAYQEFNLGDATPHAVVDGEFLIDKGAPARVADGELVGLDVGAVAVDHPVLHVGVIVPAGASPFELEMVGGEVVPRFQRREGSLHLPDVATRASAGEPIDEGLVGCHGRVLGLETGDIKLPVGHTCVILAAYPEFNLGDATPHGVVDGNFLSVKGARARVAGGELVGLGVGAVAVDHPVLHVGVIVPAGASPFELDLGGGEVVPRFQRREGSLHLPDAATRASDGEPIDEGLVYPDGAALIRARPGAAVPRGHLVCCAGQDTQGVVIAVPYAIGNIGEVGEVDGDLIAKNIIGINPLATIFIIEKTLNILTS